MLTLETILKVVSYAGTVLVFVIPMLLSLSKAKSDGRLKDVVVDVFKGIPLLMIKAEKLFGAGRGDQKLDWVLTQMRLQAYENAFQLNEDEAKKQIEAIIETTKNVNTVVNDHTKNQIGGTK